ncbi:MAG: hypothetical protein ACI3X1_01255 [Eubacteriales bacterium]
MKKYIITIASAVLALAALFTFINSPAAAVTAGPGNGRDDEVEDFEDLYSLLDFFTGKTNEDNKEIKNKYDVSFLSFTDDESDSEAPLKKIKTKKHTSVTYTEFSDMSMEMTHKRTEYYDSNSKPYYVITGKTKVQFRRSLTIYITEDASYYISKGNINSSYTDNSDSDNSGKSSFDFDMEIFFKEDIALIKFNTFIMSSNKQTTSIKDEYIGKWIKMSKDIGQELLSSIDQYNRETLSEIQEIIENEILGSEESEFKEKDNIFTLKDNNLGIDVTVDLSNITCPSIEFIMDEDSEDSEDHSYLLDVMTFENIDNTVINMNTDSDDIIALDNPDDFENLFDVSE